MLEPRVVDSRKPQEAEKQTWLFSWACFSFRGEKAGGLGCLLFRSMESQGLFVMGAGGEGGGGGGEPK